MKEKPIPQCVPAHVGMFYKHLFLFQKFIQQAHTHYPHTRVGVNPAGPVRTRRKAPSRPRRPRWRLPGIRPFSDTWTESCGAGSGICGREAGRPRAEEQGSEASTARRGPRSLLGPRPARLLQSHLLRSPSRAPAECVHWGTKRK